MDDERIRKLRVKMATKSLKKAITLATEVRDILDVECVDCHECGRPEYLNFEEKKMDDALAGAIGRLLKVRDHFYGLGGE